MIEARALLRVGQGKLLNISGFDDEKYEVTCQASVF